jgi:hypothetical protein
MLSIEKKIIYHLKKLLDFLGPEYFIQSSRQCQAASKKNSKSSLIKKKNTNFPSN